MVDLVWMMNKLVDEEGNILVEGIMDSVAPVTKEEEAKYHNIGRTLFPSRASGTDFIFTVMLLWNVPVR